MSAGLSVQDTVLSNLIFVPGDLAKAAIAAYAGQLVTVRPRDVARQKATVLQKGASKFRC